MAYRQACENPVTRPEQNSILRLAAPVFDGVVNYLRTLVQFLGNRYAFAHLIVHQRYIDAEQVLRFYLTGAALSILIPYLLSAGALTPSPIIKQWLVGLPEMPPLLSEVITLVIATVQVSLLAIGMRRGLRHLVGLRRRQGQRLPAVDGVDPRSARYESRHLF